jgi:hypothetical protein
VTALVCTAAGVIVGAPFGFVIGRFAWRVTEDALYVKSAAPAALPVLVLVTGAAAVAAVLVAAWPAWTVAHHRAPPPVEQEQLLAPRD